MSCTGGCQVPPSAFTRAPWVTALCGPHGPGALGSGAMYVWGTGSQESTLALWSEPVAVCRTIKAFHYAQFYKQAPPLVRGLGLGPAASSFCTPIALGNSCAAVRLAET